MTIIKITNPFEPRVLRIFAAGDEFHHLMKMVFKKVGIFVNSQDDLDEKGEAQFSVIEPTDKTLKILGKYDLKAGGMPDLEKAKKFIEESDFSDFVKEKSKKIAEYFANKFADGLKPMIL